MTKLADRLRELRETRGVTLREVEAATGISNAYVSQLERGKAASPAPEKLYALSEYYEVPYESLMEAAGYIQTTKSERDFSSFEDELMSMNLTESEKKAVRRFITGYLRSDK